MEVLKFKKPFEFEGKTFEKIEMDLDNLRGSDILEAHRQFTAAGHFSAMAATDPNFCLRLAATASSQPLEFFEQLPAPEFVKANQTVSNFLLSSGLIE